MTLADLPTGLVMGLAVVLGLLFGSFANVVIYRVPLGESVVYPGSRCPSCGKSIPGWNNLPVLSWLLLRGRSSCCRSPISFRYPLIEALGGALAAAVMLRVVYANYATAEWWVALLAFLAFTILAIGLLCAVFIDLEHMLLPDTITIGGTALGFATIWLRPEIGWQGSLIGAAVGFVMIWLPFIFLYERLRGQPGMGLGDAKLVMLAGAWFGWQGAVFALLAGAVQGTIVMLIVLLVAGKIETPEGVIRQREELLEAIEAAEGEEREALEREFAEDPAFHADEDAGIGKAQLAFGPFLVLAILEYMLLGEGLIWDTLMQTLVAS